MTPERARERIQKLLALAAAGSGASAEEARTAAVAAARLMTEHGLAPGDGASVPRTGVRWITWTHSLSSFASRAWNVFSALGKRHTTGKFARPTGGGLRSWRTSDERREPLLARGASNSQRGLRSRNASFWHAAGDALGPRASTPSAGSRSRGRQPRRGGHGGGSGTRTHRGEHHVLPAVGRGVSHRLP